MPDPIIWSAPPMQLKIPEGEIHIWRADLDLGPEVLNRLTITLDTAEQSRAARYHFPRDRNYFIACRGILRELLGEYLGSSPAAIEFSYGANGKPAHHPED